METDQISSRERSRQTRLVTQHAQRKVWRAVKHVLGRYAATFAGDGFHAFDDFLPVKSAP